CGRDVGDRDLLRCRDRRNGRNGPSQRRAAAQCLLAGLSARCRAAVGTARDRGGDHVCRRKGGSDLQRAEREQLHELQRPLTGGNEMTARARRRHLGNGLAALLLATATLLPVLASPVSASTRPRPLSGLGGGGPDYINALSFADSTHGW